MNKYGLIFLPAIFFLLISCTNNNKANNDSTKDSLASVVRSKREDTATLKFTGMKTDSPVVNSNTPPFLNAGGLKIDDFIKQYPANQHAELRRYIAWLIKKWQNVPNPLTATYQGNDFGDYHHILFKAADGTVYDFGQANNSYGPYKLHELSGNYTDNPEFTGKEFKIYWDWKLADFLCCDGEYGKAKAYLPVITKLELIK